MCLSAQQGHEVVLGEERDKAVGDDDGRPVGGHSIEPVGIGEVRGDVVSVGRLWQQVRPQSGNGGEVDVVPVDGRRRIDAEHPAVQAGTKVQHDRVRMVHDKPAYDLVKPFGP